MFTGIITDIGTVVSLQQSGDLTAQIKTSYDISSIEIGASIAHNGICLTVTKKVDDTYFVDISNETINCTNVNSWEIGSKINLERSLKIGDEIGGHLVSGHVDGLAEVVSIEENGESHEISMKAPDELKYFIAAKGSIVLDGISLTVNKIEDNIFYINIIPHTWEVTNFSELSIGKKINLEIDTLARYVARLNEQEK